MTIRLIQKQIQLEVLSIIEEWNEQRLVIFYVYEYACDVLCVLVNSVIDVIKYNFVLAKRHLLQSCNFL